MRKMTIAAALATVPLPSLSGCKKDVPAATSTDVAAATTGIDGTWKADLASVQVDSKPNEILLQGGKYTCKSCIPSYSVAADGAFHPVTRPYADSMSVKANDDQTVTLTSKKAGATVGTTKYTVSADGKTLTSDFTDSSVPNAMPVTGHVTQARVADAPAGAHKVSGSWRIAKYDNISDEGLVVTFKTDGDMLHMTTPSGVSYDAKVGGPAVPIKGDTAGTMAAVAKKGDSYVETDTRDGKTVGVMTFTPTADGKLHSVSEDPRDGSKTTYDAMKS